MRLCNASGSSPPSFPLCTQTATIAVPSISIFAFCGNAGMQHSAVRHRVARLLALPQNPAPGTALYSGGAHRPVR
jgi:hypothetical protein